LLAESCDLSLVLEGQVGDSSGLLLIRCPAQGPNFEFEVSLVVLDHNLLLLLFEFVVFSLQPLLVSLESLVGLSKLLELASEAGNLCSLLVREAASLSQEFGVVLVSGFQFSVEVCEAVLEELGLLAVALIELEYVLAELPVGGLQSPVLGLQLANTLLVTAQLCGCVGVNIANI
jgi:hypothetical protein